ARSRRSDAGSVGGDAEAEHPVRSGETEGNGMIPLRRRDETSHPVSARPSTLINSLGSYWRVPLLFLDLTNRGESHMGYPLVYMYMRTFMLLLAASVLLADDKT